MIDLKKVEQRLGIRVEHVRLMQPLIPQRLPNLGNEPWQVALGIGGVFAFNYVIAGKGEIVANEIAAAEAEADRETLVC